VKRTEKSEPRVKRAEGPRERAVHPVPHDFRIESRNWGPRNQTREDERSQRPAILANQRIRRTVTVGRTNRSLRPRLRTRIQALRPAFQTASQTAHSPARFLWRCRLAGSSPRWNQPIGTPPAARQPAVWHGHGFISAGLSRRVPSASGRRLRAQKGKGSNRWLEPLS